MTRCLQSFVGAWRIARRIDDRKAGAEARFDGHAVLTSEDAGVAYCETGLLQMPGQAPISAERRYLWRSTAQGIGIHFDDGRFFHGFDPRGDGAEAAHFCDPDQYDVRYDFSAWPRWQAIWTVRGPRKDYTMVSAYAR